MAQKKGLAKADQAMREEVARMGGEAQGQENNPANFANDTKKASRAGKTGGQKSRRS